MRNRKSVCRQKHDDTKGLFFQYSVCSLKVWNIFLRQQQSLRYKQDTRKQPSKFIYLICCFDEVTVMMLDVFHSSNGNFW